MENFSAHSKGTAILFNNSVIDKNLSHDIKNVHMSEDGRIYLINLVVENKEFTLINVYSPNSPKERKCFFNKKGKWISNFSTNYEIIIGGDFNLTETKMIE